MPEKVSLCTIDLGYTRQLISLTEKLLFSTTLDLIPLLLRFKSCGDVSANMKWGMCATESCKLVRSLEPNLSPWGRFGLTKTPLSLQKGNYKI